MGSTLGNWVKILDDKEEKITVNVADIRRTTYEGKNLIGLFINLEKKKPKIFKEISQTPLKSMKYIEWHDCKNRSKSEIASYYYYDVNNSVLGSGSNQLDELDFNVVISDTVGDVIQTVGCMAAMYEDIKNAKTESEIADVVSEYSYYAKLAFADDEK